MRIIYSTNFKFNYASLSLKIMYFDIITLNYIEMINMHSKYDNMHVNEIFYALICINNHVITSIDCMVLIITPL